MLFRSRVGSECGAFAHVSAAWGWVGSECGAFAHVSAASTSEFEFLVQWCGVNPVTGEAWEPSWEPFALLPYRRDPGGFIQRLMASRKKKKCYFVVRDPGLSSPIRFPFTYSVLPHFSFLFPHRFCGFWSLNVHGPDALSPLFVCFAIRFIIKPLYSWEKKV